MARNVKVGIDYFSHDVDMLQDIKVKLLKAKYGLIGYAIYLRLLEELYRDKGYYLERNETFDLLFCDDNNIEVDVYINVINDCINQGLFDKNIFNDYNILTSKRIQENYCAAVERRKEVEFVKEYLLVDVFDIYSTKIEQEKINVIINEINVDIKVENTDISTQSKVKENKVKEIKEKKNTYSECVKLTQEQYDKLLQDFGLQITTEYIDKLNDYIMSKGVKYKSHYHTIRQWLRKEIKQQQNKPQDETQSILENYVKAKGMM